MPQQSKLLHGMTILVVEDHEYQKMQIKHNIQLHGGRVHVAANGREALEVLATATPAPQAVVSDIDMPEMNGLQLADAVAKSQRPVPVILLSDKEGKFDEAARASRSAAAIMLKIDWPLLADTIKRVVPPKA